MPWLIERQVNMIHNTNRGSALVIAIVTSVVIVSLAGSAIYMAAYEQRYSNKESYRMKARYVAEAGIARAIKYVNSNFANVKLSFTEIDALANTTLFSNEAFLAASQGQNVKVGEYSVTLRVLTEADFTPPEGEDIKGNKVNSLRYFLVTSTGFVPSAAKPESKITINATYQIGTRVAHVFDYSYFINNWGWFYTTDLSSFGNVRSNGAFSFGSYKPVIESKPRFEYSIGTDLIGYIDDNGDGKENNQDGGVYAWDYIQGAPSTLYKPDLYQGLKGANTRPEVPQVPMPNLTNLGLYEQMSKEQGSYIKIAGTTICDGVLGDNETKQNLYLEGTYENPIEIKGTIVVRGDCIIRGYVSGKGVIYAGRNIYIPQRILYRNPPSERRPSTNSEASRENWRERADDKDLLGLFAREHVVIGDYTNSTWQNYVSQWVNDSMNKSKEDAGPDKIPNTYDAGEGDGKWTVELDPSGNPIPGTGEDIDGDGKFDDTTKMSEFNLGSGTFSTGHAQWAGNIPTGVTSYRQVTYWNDTTDNPGISGSSNFPQVDAVLYCNHFVGGYFYNFDYSYKNDNRGHFTNKKEIAFNGSIISRNESLIFENGNKVVLFHDERLTAETGERFGLTMPRVWKPLKLISMSID